MSTAPEPAAAGSDVSGPTKTQRFRNCWSCRVLSGTGLLVAGAYVAHAAQRVMRQGAVTSMGTVAQITFAAGLAAWGIVIIADPVGKMKKA